MNADRQQNKNPTITYRKDPEPTETGPTDEDYYYHWVLYIISGSGSDRIRHKNNKQNDKFWYLYKESEKMFLKFKYKVLL